jgi:hypothetical protein
LVKTTFALDQIVTRKIQEGKDHFDPDDIRSFVDIYLKAEMDGEIVDKKSGIIVE